MVVGNGGKMDNTLTIVMQLLMLVHNENMGLFKLLLGKKGDKIINSYKNQYQEILNGDLMEEK